MFTLTIAFPIIVIAQKTITIDNNTFFNEVLHFIDGGRSVVFRAKGHSMIPFIYDSEKVLLEKSNYYKQDDIVLAHLSNGHYVLHRIYFIEADTVFLMGDGNLFDIDYCHPDSLKALCKKKYNEQGEIILLDTDKQKSKAELWKACIYQREELLSSFSLDNNNNMWAELFRSFISNNDSIILTIRPNYEIKEMFKKKFLLSSNTQTSDFTELIQMNETADIIFERMKGREFNVDDIVNELLLNYEIDEDTARNDAFELLTTWFTYGILKLEL